MDHDTFIDLVVAAAVFDALARTVSREEWDDMVAELPSGFAPLLPRGPYLEVVDSRRSSGSATI